MEDTRTGHRGRRLAWWLLATVVSAVIGILIGWKIVPLLPLDPTCEAPTGLHPLRTDVAVSPDLGEYPPTSAGTTFVGANMVDGDATTAWVENQPGERRGEGGDITFQFDADDDGAFDDTVTPKLICIRNGFTKRPDLFRTNASVKTADVRVDGVTRETSIPRKTADRMLEMDSLNFRSTSTQSVTLVIVASNEPWTTGTTDAFDLAITDIIFYASGN